MTNITKQRLLTNLETMKQIGFEYIKFPKLDTQIKTTKLNQTLPNQLNQLENITTNCYLCDLSKHRKNVLFGTGNKNADIVFLGLAPLYIEDETNNILYGNSGSMLTNMAQNVLNTPIEDIYVTNMLKCTTKSMGNIDDQVDICKSYIYKQLDIINPKIIVAFGDVYKYLVPQSKSFDSIKGIWQKYNDTKVMPTYHPSFILRNPSLKQSVLEDLKKVKQLMELF